MHIAITASINKTQQYYINIAYIKYLLKAGYTPHVIHTKEEITPALKICDGLLLPGGIDLDPMYYGYTNYSSFVANPEKDDFERTAFHTFRTANKTIFGICRGFQLIAMEFLDEFSEYEKVIKFMFHIENHNQTHHLEIERKVPTHFVNYVPEYLYGKTGKASDMNGLTISNLGVNSMHHQCLVEKFAYATKNSKTTIIKTDYKNFVKIAWTQHSLAADDRKGTIVEAFEIKNWDSKIIAVQWHPEELYDTAILHNVFGGQSTAKKEN